MTEADAVAQLFFDLLAAWDRRDAAGMAALLTDDGFAVGFDGSTHDSPAALADDLTTIFAQHATPAFVAKVRDVRFLLPDVAVLRAHAVMAAAGASDVLANTQAVQTLVAVRREQKWRVAVFQNTPAAFHGRPEMVAEQLAELCDVWRAQMAEPTTEQGV